jgi:hypothetical protein
MTKAVIFRVEGETSSPGGHPKELAIGQPEPIFEDTIHMDCGY